MKYSELDLRKLSTEEVVAIVREADKQNLSYHAYLRNLIKDHARSLIERSKKVVKSDHSNFCHSYKDRDHEYDCSDYIECDECPYYY